MTSFFERRDRLRSRLPELGLDALLISYATNVQYLTGFTGGASYLIVAKASDMLVSDGRFTEQIVDEAPGLASHIRSLKETTLDALGEVIAKLGLHNVGIESARMAVSEFEALKSKLSAVNWSLTNGIVEEQRAIKDEHEVDTIRRAIVVAEKVYEQFRRDLLPNDTELELSDRVEALVRRFGGRGTSFEPIVAVGERSALAHAPPTSRQATSGSWLLLDWGAIVDGYRSDLTRILIPNRPPVRTDATPLLDRDRLATAYQAILAARECALAVLRPGAVAKEVDAAARAALAEFGLAEQFTHSLGHGLGLETHEKPGLRASSDEVLQAGMVVTIEPGVYVPGWGGIRVEDDVLITTEGPQFLGSLAYDFESAFI
jgi:Xaa-Pro aminopeptidase